MPTTHRRFPVPLFVLTLLCAFSFAAIVTVARADHWHATCSWHGFVHGTDTGDGSFFSRVEYGCGSGSHYCAIYSGGAYRGASAVSGTNTCNAWSWDYGTFTECASYAKVSYDGGFSLHDHFAHNWCG